MKKFLFIAAFSILAFASSAHAQTVQPGGLCTTDSPTNQCTSGYTCDSLTSICVPVGTPTINPNPPSTGTTPNYSDGSTCTPACGSNQVCSGGLCIANLAQTVSQGTGNAQPGFVPLAPIPGLTADQNGNSLLGIPDLATFLDNLYKYLIGIAAILAVIEIIYGGLQYATQDSVSKKGEGRERIEHAVLGLVLVLSPALIFSIINPSILNLSLNLPALNTAPGHNVAPAGPISQNIACAGTDCTLAIQQCNAMVTPDSGSATALCASDSGGSSEPGGGPNSDVACRSGFHPSVLCEGTANTGGAGQAGTTPNANTIPLFDGAYMDLVKYIGPNAENNSVAYQCQSTGQTRDVFAFTNNSTGTVSWYAVCLTPRLNYDGISVNLQSVHADAASSANVNKYEGECKAVASALAGENTTSSISLTQDPNPAATPKACSAADAQVSSSAQCFSVYDTCARKISQ